MNNREVILIKVSEEDENGNLVGGSMSARGVKAYALREGDKLSGGIVDNVTKFRQLLPSSPSAMRARYKSVVMAFDEDQVCLGEWCRDTLVVLEA